MATAAAWKLWERGFRKGANIEAEYRRWPAFAKFVARDDDDRARGRHLEPGWTSHCQRHWEPIASRVGVQLRPQNADPADAELISEVLADVASWDDAALVAAAVATINRFGDGHGTRSRPISVRCMAAWLNIRSVTTANALIKGLCQRGFLTLVRPHDAHTAGNEASQYNLTRPDPVYHTDRVHEVTDRGALTHPLWGQLGQRARHAWQHLTRSPHGLPTSALSTLTGTPPGTATSGLGLLLRKLEAAGLARADGHGRGRRWYPTARTLDAAASALEVPVTRRALLTRINLERAAWHAQSRRARQRAVETLKRAQKRTQRAQKPLQLALATDPWDWTFSRSHGLYDEPAAPRARPLRGRLPRNGRRTG